MKILHVCGSFPPAYAYGGPPRSVHNLTSALVDRGHDVTVYTTDAMDAEKRVDGGDSPSITEKVDVRRFRNVSNHLAWRNIQTPPGMLIALLQNAEKFDVIHSHEFRSPPTAFAHFAACQTGVPHVHQPRGSIPRLELKYLKILFDTILGRNIISNVDRLIASSPTESKNYPSIFPQLDSAKVSHVPNGISPKLYQDLPEPGTFKAAQGINSKEQVILFLSRLHPRKGGDLLIEAVSRLTADNVRLAFVGPDEGAQDNWEDLVTQEDIEDNVIFTGPQYGKRKLSAYVDADVFVLPSKNEYESFGNVVIEALACGTPVVATNVCGVSEWLNHEGCRFVAPTATTLHNAIKNVLQENTPPAHSIRNYVWENFTWEAVAADTEAIYEEVKG